MPFLNLYAFGNVCAQRAWLRAALCQKLQVLVWSDVSSVSLTLRVYYWGVSREVGRD